LICTRFSKLRQSFLPEGKEVKKMRQLTLNTDRKVEWQEVAPPSLSGPRAAIVKPVAVATCDFDHLVVAGSMPLPLPIPIGHEFVAEVIEVGAEVAKVRAGDLVSGSVSDQLRGMLRLFARSHQQLREDPALFVLLWPWSDSR
jgi:NADPH:quinone reductase-like Zn-dependent oxidoreductase